jgi:hypothetical protein
MVDTYVGLNSKHDSVPKDLLCYHSPFFDRCLNGNFKEATELKVTLPEDSIEDFEIVLNYILTRRVATPLELNLHAPNPKQRCIHLINYANKYGVSEAVEKIHDEIAQLHGARGVKPKLIEAVFRAFPPKHPLRKLIGTIALFHILEDGMSDYEKARKEISGFTDEMFDQLCDHVSENNVPPFPLSFFDSD